MDTGTVKLFNAEECLKIVRKSLNLQNDKIIELLSYGIVNASNDLVGYMGDYFKLKVYFKDVDGSVRDFQYFVKSVPIANEYHKDECERKGFFGKEGRIYTEILSHIQRYASSKLSADCYYARHDLLVLEDLTLPIKSFSHLSAKEEFTEVHLKQMLRHMAELHGASIAWESAESINLGEQFKDVLFELLLTTDNEWFVTGVKSIIFLAKMQPKYQSQDVQKFIDEKLYKILCNLEDLTMPSKVHQNVFCHRDSWRHNIFFKFNNDGQPIDSRIVDFQLSSYCPPGIDVLFLIYANTSRQRRHLIYDECLDYYHETLTSILKRNNLPVTLVTRDSFMQDCQRARLAVLVMMAICEPLMKMPSGVANKMRAEEAEKFDFYMNTQRDELFIRVMAMEPSYRATIMAPIEELLDYLLQHEELHG